MLNLALQKLDVINAGLLLVLTRERQHFICHVQPVSLAGGPDSLCGQQHIDAAARAQVQHRFAGAQLCERCRIPAAERG